MSGFFHILDSDNEDDVKVVAKPAAAPAAAGKKDAAPAKADSSKAKAAPKKGKFTFLIAICIHTCIVEVRY